MLPDDSGLLQSVIWLVGSVTLLVLLLAALGKVWSMLCHRPLLDISGRWVVVTGCDSGIGRGVLAGLVGRGAKVIALCYTEAGSAAALAEGAALAPRVDLCDQQQVLDTVQQVQAQTGGELWGLVHAAGSVLPGFVDYQPIAFYRDVMEVNFFAPVLLTQKLLPMLRKARGRVVIVSSVDGLVSLPGNAPYDASKFAVEAYADALRAELSFWDVGVSVVNPSTMRTPMSEGFFAGHRKAWEETERLDPDGDWKQAWPADWLDAYVDLNTRQLDRISQDPAAAIDDIVHAVAAVRPRLRYLSGTLAKTLFYLLWIGPEAWALRFKRVMIQPPPPVNS